MADIDDFDVYAHNLIALAPSNSAKAQEALAHAAAQIRQGKPLLDPLAAWIADAFEVAAAKGTAAESASALAEELCLKSLHQRPKAYSLGVAWTVSGLVKTKDKNGRILQDGKTLEAAVAEVAEEEGISESTVKRHYQDHQEEIEKYLAGELKG